GTRGSASSARNGARAGLESGGRLRGGSPAASSPSGARWPKGRYQDRSGVTASDIPTSVARSGSTDVVSVSSATSGAARHSARTAATPAASSAIRAPAAAGGAAAAGAEDAGGTGGARGAGGRVGAEGAGRAGEAPSSRSNRGIKDRNSSSVKSSVSRGTSGGRSRRASASSGR